ncbi:MAG: hypothetical protein F2840_15010 [Actinobacteria bacterium]|nr:hypothetical protein [Actinomycetota bacterium]
MTAAGFRVSSRSWHDLRDLAGAAGFDTRKTRVSPEVSAASLRALVSQLRVERPDVDLELQAEKVMEGISAHFDAMSTISIVKFLTEHGVAVSLLAVKAARKARRQGSGSPVDAASLRLAQRARFAAEDNVRARRTRERRRLERRGASRAAYRGELQGQEPLY